MSKVKVIQSSWMYVTYRTMVIHSRAKQSMAMSKHEKAYAWTQIHVINPINLTLRSKVNIVSGSWMYVIHTFMVIDPCAKYGKPMSIQKLLWAGHKNMSKPIYIWPWDQSARSYLDHECTRHIFLIWYTHVSNMVIDPCAKYGKPMSNQKIVMGWT